jgi:hypothetical protein
MTYIYIYTPTHLFNSEVARKWDRKHFKFIFEIFSIQISAQRSLLFTRVEVYFTPWVKCRDTLIICNYNVTDSSHILCSSFFTNQRTVRCYTLCNSQPRYINHKQNKDTQTKLCKLSSGFAPFNIIWSNAQSSNRWSAVLSRLLRYMPNNRVGTRHLGAPSRTNNLKPLQTHTL